MSEKKYDDHYDDVIDEAAVLPTIPETNYSADDNKATAKEIKNVGTAEIFEVVCTLLFSDSHALSETRLMKDWMGCSFDSLSLNSLTTREAWWVQT